MHRAGGPFASPGGGARGARGRGLAHWCTGAPPSGGREWHGPPFPRPPLPAAAPASAPRARSPRCRRHCRTCHHVAAAGSCLTLSGPRFPISRCPPSLAAVCSAAPRGRTPIPQTLTRPSPPKPSLWPLPQGGARDAAPGPAAPEVPVLPLPTGEGAELGTVWAETGGTVCRRGPPRGGGGGGCAGWGVAAPLSTGAADSGNPVGVGEEGEGGGLGTLGTIAAA